MSASSAVVANFDSYTEAQAGVRKLERSGFDMKKLSDEGRNPSPAQVIVRPAAQSRGH